MMTMGHEDERLSAYLDGELSAEDRAEVERALASDADLRRTLEELRSVQAGLRMLPHRPAPPGLAAAVLARVAAEQRQAPPRTASGAGAADGNGQAGGAAFAPSRRRPSRGWLRAGVWFASGATAAALTLSLWTGARPLQGPDPVVSVAQRREGQDLDRAAANRAGESRREDSAFPARKENEDLSSTEFISDKSAPSARPTLDPASAPVVAEELQFRTAPQDALKQAKPLAEPLQEKKQFQEAKLEKAKEANAKGQAASGLAAGRETTHEEAAEGGALPQSGLAQSRAATVEAKRHAARDEAIAGALGGALPAHNPSWVVVCDVRPEVLAEGGFERLLTEHGVARASDSPAAATPAAGAPAAARRKAPNEEAVLVEGPRAQVLALVAGLQSRPEEFSSLRTYGFPEPPATAKAESHEDRNELSAPSQVAGGGAGAPASAVRAPGVETLRDGSNLDRARQNGVEAGLQLRTLKRIDADATAKDARALAETFAKPDAAAAQPPAKPGAPQPDAATAAADLQPGQARRGQEQAAGKPDGERVRVLILLRAAR